MNIDEMLRRETAEKNKAGDNIAALIAVKAAFPDAEVWTTEEGLCFEAASAHAVADRFDPASAKRVTGRRALYTVVAVGNRKVRVHSPRRFDVVRGFQRYYGANGADSLPDALRSTCDELDTRFESDATAAQLSADAAHSN